MIITKKHLRTFDIAIKIYAMTVLVITAGFREKLPEKINNNWWIFFLTSILILILIKRLLNSKVDNEKRISTYR